MNPQETSPQIKDGLVEALAKAYATLVKRQRSSTAFVRWTAPRRRQHDFVWLDPGQETLFSSGREVTVKRSSPASESINGMMSAIELNPYERELYYGYPYLYGFVDGVAVRAPVFAMPVSIVADGSSLVIAELEDVLRFNSLPFRTEHDSAAKDQALARLIDATPGLPLSPATLRSFCENLLRDLGVENDALLDGSLAQPPAEPKAATPLRVIDAAACFIAPKGNYFLASDLELIAAAGSSGVARSAWGWLIGKRGTLGTSDDFRDSRKVFFPFSSNQSQRRVALLAADPNNRIIVVQGPPGTGKSLTIANAACDLVARGKRVLISSQKNKALEVVDDLLRHLGLEQMPMTLLRQDRESRRALRESLECIRKQRAAEETRKDVVRESGAHAGTAAETASLDNALAGTLRAEHEVYGAAQSVRAASSLLRRWKARASLQLTLWSAGRKAPRLSDDLAEQGRQRRAELLNRAVRVLKMSAEDRVAEATRDERNNLHEFAKLLGRDQGSAKNFSVFDRLKRDPERCHSLLKILPCWIMTPDDVARLFPCEPGLFDVVIIDEASQCDLPSMMPVLYRARQAIIAGDSKQMQSQRFAFTSTQVAAQAWSEQKLGALDPEGNYDPARTDLLALASIRKDEEAFLDEHYRCLPPIISFSNKRWYRDRLRIMRDEDDKRFGDQDSAAVVLHRVADGSVHAGTQENEREAAELVGHLKALMEHPGYAEATFGVICLFEEQMRLMNDLVRDQIPEELRTSHDLVVVNPDGFQGDERDVIFYSLSYDANGMTQSALSARQADREHVQGMLNVAFTRARDEMHIFHTAAVAEFGMASGGGAIREWLEHCQSCGAAVVPESAARSEFEADVAGSLGVKTVARYPACGLEIDIVAESNGRRVAVECDGHFETEDVARQETLERAGWTVVRIPYRAWRVNREAQVRRVLSALEGKVQPAHAAVVSQPADPVLVVDAQEAAVISALKDGASDLEEVVRGARTHLGHSRLGPRIRSALEHSVAMLRSRGVIYGEENEYFLSEAARGARISVRVARSRGRR